MTSNRLEILKYGEQVLREKSKNIIKIDNEINSLIENMKKALYDSGNGVGLAAPQVGVNVRLSIIDTSMGENPEEFMVMINPEVLESEGQETDEEGCLSFPNINLPIERPDKILLKYSDSSGQEKTENFSGFKARVIQHEIDHLNGVLIIDRVSSLKRQLTQKQIKKLKKNGEW